VGYVAERWLAAAGCANRIAAGGATVATRVDGTARKSLSAPQARPSVSLLVARHGKDVAFFLNTQADGASTPGTKEKP